MDFDFDLNVNSDSQGDIYDSENISSQIFCTPGCPTGSLQSGMCCK